MENRVVINKQKISTDLSKRYGFIILMTLSEILGLATIALVVTLLFDERFLALKIVLWCFLSLYAILKIYLCIYVIYAFKTAKFTVEIDTILKIEYEKLAIVYEIVYVRGYRKFMDKITFENSGKAFAHKDEIGHPSVGDKYYLVKIKIFNKAHIVSFYNERAYTYKND